MSFTGIAFAPTPGDCTDGSCCVPTYCGANIIICWCCPFDDRPFDGDSDGPHPTFFVLAVDFSNGCGVVLDGNSITFHKDNLDEDGTVTVHTTQSLFWSYDINGTPSPGGTVAINDGDIINNFTVNANSGNGVNVNCTLKDIHFGVYVADEPNNCPCWAIYFDTGIGSNKDYVDCSAQVSCDTGLPLSTTATPPHIAKRAFNLVLAMLKHIASGAERRSKQEIERIHTICTGNKEIPKCAYYSPQYKICMHGKCGCNLSEENALLNKLALKSEKCPTGKWV